MVENYNIKILCLSERLTYKNGNGFGIAFAHQYPIRFSDNIKRQIKKEALDCIKKLKIKNGIVYPQIKIDSNQKIFFIEIAARLPGGKMPEVALLASGYDIRKFEILNAFGIKNKIQKSRSKIKKKKQIYVRFFTRREIKSYKTINIKKINSYKKRIIFFR